MDNLATSLWGTIRERQPGDKMAVSIKGPGRMNTVSATQGVGIITGINDESILTIENRGPFSQKSLACGQNMDPGEACGVDIGSVDNFGRKRVTAADPMLNPGTKS